MKCLGYCSFANSECLYLGSEEDIWIGGGRKSLKIVKGGKIEGVETTMSSISTIKRMKKGLVCVGGSQGTVEIYKDEDCMMVLFVWEE